MWNERGLMQAGALAAWAAALLTLLWLVMLLALPILPEDVSLEEELIFIVEHQSAHVALYAGIFLLVIVQLPFLLALTALVRRRRGGLALVWGALSLLYVLLSSTAYWLQLTVARGLADLFVNSEDAVLQASALSTYLTWGYNGRLTAAPYALDQLGYLFYSMALMGFGLGLIREKGIDLVSGGLLILAATSGIVGIVGYLGRNPFLENGVALSGAIVMPAYFTLAYRFLREAQMGW